MNSIVLPHRELKTTSALREQPGVLVVTKHHVLVRFSHWLNIPLLFGLILGGISIYWASPIYQHKPDPITETQIGQRTLESGYGWYAIAVMLTLLADAGAIQLFGLAFQAVAN